MNIREAIKKSLFFTGAGFSKEAGCKMSSEMLDDLKEIICYKENKYFSEIECETIKFLFSCLNYQTEWRTLEINNQYSFSTNIEELALLIRRIKNRENFLPYPVTGNWADKLIMLETKFREVEGIKNGYSLFEKIENTLKNKLLFNWLEVKNTEFLKPLDNFFEKNSQEDFLMEIFTLNNDTVVEKHYSDKKARPYCGFYSGEWRGFDEPTNMEELNRFNLYKIHGSLDWMRLKDGSIVDYSRKEEIPEEEIEHNPFIIFGHGIKLFSVEPFFSLIQKFKDKLRERNYFFIIGYSFFDPYINNLIFQAVREGQNGNKKIIIINPNFAIPPLDGDSHFKIDKDFGLLLDNDNIEAKKKLINYVEEIQRNAFYSELPEFNIKRVPAESLSFIKMSTGEFLEKYLKNSGELLIKLLQEYEEEEEKGLPFRDEKNTGII